MQKFLYSWMLQLLSNVENSHAEKLRNRTCYSLAAASHAAAPPPVGVRRTMGRTRQKLVSRDKGSLTEQQTKGTATTTTIQIRRIHNTKQHNPESLSHRSPATRSRAVSEFLPPSSPPPEPSMTAHGMEYPVLFGQVGSARLAVFPPAPGEN